MNSRIVESHQTELGVETIYQIKASKEGWVPYALLRVKCLWSDDGTQFTCTAVEYRATDNGRSSGNVWIEIWSGGVIHWRQELTDSAVQNGQWHDLGHSRIMVGNRNTAEANFSYVYDIAGRTADPNADPLFLGSEVMPYKPPTPRITYGTETDAREFDLTGALGVNGATVNIYNSIDQIIGTALVQTGGNWSARVSMPSSNTLTVYARQSINGKASDKSNVVTIVYRVSDIVIESPKAGDVITVPTPTLTGKGHDGARIDIYQQGGIGGIYGTGTVQGTEWRVQLTKALSHGPFTFQAEQVTPSGDRKWSNTVPVTVQLKPKTPTITQPGPQSEQNRSFTLSGIGGEVGASMKIYRDLTAETVGTLARVLGDAWSVDVVIPASFPSGEVRLVAEQTLGIPSDRSVYRPFKIKPDKVNSLAAVVDGNATVTLTGGGTVGATLHIHYVGDQTPIESFLVISSPWSRVFHDWLPAAASYSIQARQSVSGADGLPVYSDWTDKAVTFNVDVPKPTLTHRVSPEGIPAFSGTGRNWSGQRACQIEVRLNNASQPIVPIVDVLANSTWSSAASERWAPGSHPVTARQLFEAIPSAWLVPPVDVVVPAPLAVIDRVVENGLSPQVEGQCWPGANLTITFSDKPDPHLVSDTDQDGQWTFRRPAAFRPGQFTVTVTQTFGGQTSNAVSMPFDIPVSVPVITPPADGQTDHLPVLHGTGGILGALIQVLDFVTHEVLGEALAAGDNWSVELNELDYLDHTVFAIQILGDLHSSNSAAVTFTVVLFAPIINRPLTNTSVPRTFMVEGNARSGKGFDRVVVELYLNGVLQPPVYPHMGGGYFSHVLSLPVGACDIQARQLFKDQVSPLTDEVGITVVPGLANIETPGVGEAVGHSMVFCGFGYPGDTVVAALASATGTPVLTAVVADDGTWFGWVALPKTAAELSIVIEQRNGEYVSGWSEPRKLELLNVAPAIIEPLEGAWGSPTPQFAGKAQTTALVEVIAWFDPEKKLTRRIEATAGDWSGEPELPMPEGPNWARAVQVVGGQRSQTADSKRFEVAPLDESPRRRSDLE